MQARPKPLTAEEALFKAGIKECPECHYSVDIWLINDWLFKDYSCKEIAVCPSCKTEVALKVEVV